MYDFMLDEPSRAVRDELRELVKTEIDPEYLRRMDRDEIRYPRELYETFARQNTLGLRFPREFGGRALPWVAECAAMEEVGVLGTAAGCCYVMPSIVGEAINTFGTEAQKQRYLAPMLVGRQGRGRGPHRAARRLGLLRRHRAAPRTGATTSSFAG